MIDLETLEALVKLMVENDLSELDIRDGEETVKLRRGAAERMLAQAQAAPAPMAAPAPAAPAPAAASSAPAESAEPDLPAIESPMVGTFYSAANPDSPPFVKPGDRVSADTVVCLIEAMKVFTEVKAERSGVVESVLVDNAEPVEFGQKLFLIRPA